MAAQSALAEMVSNNYNGNNHYFSTSLSEIGNRFPNSPSGADRIFPHTPAMVDMSAPQPYPNYNVYDPSRGEVDYSAQTSGLVGSEESFDEPEASGSAGRTGSDAEAEGAAKSDRAFQHLVYDPTS
jgi:hypothetical protein